jgi:hypothetical protein
MKKTLLSGIITATLLSTTSYAKDKDSHPFSRDIVLKCLGDCNPIKIIDDYLINRRYLYSGKQRITIEIEGQDTYKTTVRKHLKEKAKKQKTKAKSKNVGMLTYSKGGSSVLPNPTAYDAPLSCDWDSDFTCEEWSDDLALSELNDYVNSAKLEIIATPTYIQGCRDAVGITSAMLVAAGGIEVPVLATLFARHGVSHATQMVVSAGAAGGLFAIVDEISDAMCDSNPGDKLVFHNGAVVIESDVEINMDDLDTIGDIIDYGYEEAVNYFESYASLECIKYTTIVSGNSGVRTDWVCFFS